MNRSQFGYSGGLFHWQLGVPETDRVPLLLFPNNDISRGFEVFAKWMRDHEPDALITFDTHVPGWLKRLNLRVPKVLLPQWDQTDKSTSHAHVRRRHDQGEAGGAGLVTCTLMKTSHQPCRNAGRPA